MTTYPQNMMLSYETQGAPARRDLLPVESNGSIAVSFGHRILLFARRAPRGWFVMQSGEEIISKAKVINFIDEYKRVVILSDDPMSAFFEFASQMVWVEAAGGVVEAPDGDVVVIRRGERWDLPKGHREQNEDFDVCAAREAEEETGVRVRNVGTMLATTLHAYNLYGQWELKLTVWYHMFAHEKTELVPQSEEGITGAEWVASNRIMEQIKDSFPTIKKVFSAFFK